jgi:hypothetical protein
MTRRSVLLLASVFALEVSSSGPAAGQTFLSDDPVVKWPEPRNAVLVKPRRINEYYDFFQNIMFRPGELAERIGVGIPARAVNTLGEVPDSEWYTNRHYSRRMTEEQLVRGPGNSEPPSMAKPWSVVSAKNEGITPGFTIVDGDGRRYVLKFDPASNPEMASAADVISSKFLYALGYNVPENYIVRFRPEQLKIDGGTKFTDHYGKRRAMTERDLRDVLAKVTPGADGQIRALASRFVPGAPVGPFRYHGTRADDPNDTVPHEHRRDLRGLRVFAAWLGHDDSKSLNTLDTLVQQNGMKYVKHYLIDFGASLGSASYGPNSPRSGSDYLFQWGPAARQFMTLGMAVPKWAHAKYPDIPAVGAFEYEMFDAERWIPEYPNSAFSNMDGSDAFWAARQVMAFTENEIRAIVKTGEYSNPAAEDWVVRCLVERRSKIGRAFFKRVLPLDRFEVRDGRLGFEDLSATHFGAEQTYSVAWAVFDNKTGERSAIAAANTFDVPASASVYLVAEIRGEQAGQQVDIFVRNGREVVGRQMIGQPIGGELKLQTSLR